MSGSYRVGYKNFISEELENSCSIYYPARDDGSGKFGVPFLYYGKDDLDAMIKIGEKEVENVPILGYLVKIILRSWKNIQIPVYQDANIGPKRM